MFETVTSWQIGYIVFAGVFALILLRAALDLLVKILEVSFILIFVCVVVGAVTGIYDRIYGPIPALEGIGTKWMAFMIAAIILVTCVITIPADENTAKRAAAAKEPLRDVSANTKAGDPPKTEFK
ncbi:MAG: hypothetical protein J0H39_00655 [Alphaproteobacteria bacterium]|nr:hypothetical protein [Alphaproteobacteria bacterium]